MRRRAASALIFLLPLSPNLLLGQASPLPDSFDLHGEVYHFGTRHPVEDVAVRIPSLDRTTTTNERGQFVFRDLKPGTYEFVASKIGFRTFRNEVTVKPGNRLLYLLRPRALELDPIHVSVSSESYAERQLHKRRNAVGGSSVHVIPKDRLERTLADFALLFAEYAGLPLVPCGSTDFGDPDCFRHRGRRQRLKVCLDEGPLPGGMDVLGQYPKDRLHAVEVYPGLGQVRAYTEWYVNRINETRWRLEPISMVGGGC